jgi:hypothetical protein
MRPSTLLLTCVILAGIGFGVGHLLRATESTVSDRPDIGAATDRYIAALTANDAKAAWRETAMATRETHKVTEDAVTAYVTDAAPDFAGGCTMVKDEGFLLTEKDGKSAAARRKFITRCGDALIDVNTEVVMEGERWRTSFFQYARKSGL